MAWLVHNDGDRITENVAWDNAERGQCYLPTGYIITVNKKVVQSNA